MTVVGMRDRKSLPVPHKSPSENLSMPLQLARPRRRPAEFLVARHHQPALLGAASPL